MYILIVRAVLIIQLKLQVSYKELSRLRLELPHVYDDKHGANRTKLLDKFNIICYSNNVRNKDVKYAR